MATRIAISKERRFGETRVAATPETVKKLKGLGVDVVVEKGAGAVARFADKDYEAVGASIAPDETAALKDADIVLKVRGPDSGEIALMKRGAILAALLNPYAEKEMAAKLASAGVDAFAMEFLPRISRAQAMDVLSSQANLAGYKAVIDAAAQFGRAMPMMMTAAGTIAPARVLVMGVGRGGPSGHRHREADGRDCRRHRRASRHQGTGGKSLGGTFVAVMDDEFKTGPNRHRLCQRNVERVSGETGGLDRRNDQETGHCHHHRAHSRDARAPVLVTEEMIKSMKPGSMIVDLAVEQGGNCPLSNRAK